MLFTTPEPDPTELAVLAELDEIRSKLRFQLVEPRRWAGSLRRLSLARAIQGSNSIEGYDAGIDDVMAVAAGEPTTDSGTETEQALRGYRDAMTYVLQLAAEPDFEYSEPLLKSLHFMMTHYSLANRPGRWRAGSIFVRDEATGDVVHEGAELETVPDLMREVVAELNTGSTTPVVIRAAMAHLNLVMIHPFRDGNGRMARCLQSLVLARDTVLSPVFMSIEEYLGQNTQAYYHVLAAVGGGSWQPERDARSWIRFTLTAHLRQAHTMHRRFKDSERLWTEIERLIESHRLPERSGAALFDAALGLRVRNSTYRASFADSPEEITETTAGRDLRALVSAGLLQALGQARGRHYLGTDTLTAIHRKTRTTPTTLEPDPFAPRA